MSSNPVRDLQHESEKYDLGKADYVENVHAFHFNEQSELIVPSQMFGQPVPLRPSDRAYHQMFDKLAPVVFGSGTTRTLPADYIKAIPADLRATVMNRHISDAKADKCWMIRAYENTARAVLNHDFAAVGNSELLKIVADLIDNDPQGFADLKLVRPFLSPDDLHLKIVFRDVLGGSYGVGAYIGNGEVGNRKIKLHPLIQRTSCTNSLIIDNDAEIMLNLTHRGSAANKINLFKSALIEAFKISGDALNRLMQAETEALPDFNSVLDGLSQKYGWDDETKTNVAVGTEGKQTRAGVVHGVTFAAHHLSDPEAMIDMETLGGRILCAPGSLFADAARKSDPVRFSVHRGQWAEYLAQ